MPQFTNKSIERLTGCDDKLQIVHKLAIKDSAYPYQITHGHRTIEEQNELYQQGRTKPGKIVTNIDGITKKGKHNYSPSKASDIVIFADGKITWDKKYYKIVADHILAKAKLLGITIYWGGNWEKFRDYPHFEIE
jgi:peptidoglycan L-alanyl-D-glutamate endopeptidase CwlK